MIQSWLPNAHTVGDSLSNTSPIVLTIGSILFISICALTTLTYAAYKSAFFSRFNTELIVFSAGCLLGDVFFHVFPHVMQHNPSQSSYLVLGGILIGYFLESFIVHHHSHDHSHDHNPNYNYNHSDTNSTSTQNQNQNPKESSTSNSPKAPISIKTFVWTNLIGDFVHNFVDGMALGSAFLSGPFIGIATACAIFFHEIGAEMGDFVILVRGGLTRKQAILCNIGTSFAAIVGGIFAIVVGERIAELEETLLCITAGLFIYLALVDLLPQIHHAVEHKISSMYSVTLFLIISMVLMHSLLYLDDLLFDENSHHHGSGSSGSSHTNHHNHDDIHNTF